MQLLQTPIKIADQISFGRDYSELEMNTADRIVNIIWNTTIKDFHEQVAHNIYDSFLIYENLFSHALFKHRADKEVNGAVEYLKSLSKVVKWEAYSDQSLEFLYIGEDVEEVISDEAENSTIQKCAWQQLAESCLFEIISHLQMMSEDAESETDQQTYQAIKHEYKGLGQLLF